MPSKSHLGSDCLSDFLFSDSEWATYVLGGVVGEKTYAPKVAVNTTYGDFVHRIDLPMIKTEEKTFTFPGNSRAVSIETEYNFYVSKYEKKISNLQQQTHMMTIVLRLVV